jgi:hypothetical protein
MYDKICLWIAGKMPRRLLMWAYVVAIAKASAKNGRLTPDELTYTIVMKSVFDGGK